VPSSVFSGFVVISGSVSVTGGVVAGGVVVILPGTISSPSIQLAPVYTKILTYVSK